MSEFFQMLALVQFNANGDKIILNTSDNEAEMKLKWQKQKKKGRVEKHWKVFKKKI